MKYTHGSLFTGRGGFDIGAELCGFKSLWNCEIDVFLRHKLKNIFPNAQQFDDVKSLSYPKTVDVISAGFPCQDISISNQTGKKGIRGSRSGLWGEVARITSETMPKYLVLENSPELLKQGFEYVLSDLSALGYDAEWDCWRAADFGYPHNRKRLYVIAYPRSIGRRRRVLRPPGSFELLQTWTPTPAYIRVSVSRSKGFRNVRTIQRDNEFPYFSREIKAFGNAVMPVVAEHLFRCIGEDLK